MDALVALNVHVRIVGPLVGLLGQFFVILVEIRYAHQDSKSRIASHGGRNRVLHGFQFFQHGRFTGNHIDDVLVA